MWRNTVLQSDWTDAWAMINMFLLCVLRLLDIVTQ